MKAGEAPITWDGDPEPCVFVCSLGKETAHSARLHYSGGAAWRRNMKGKDQIAVCDGRLRGAHS